MNKLFKDKNDIIQWLESYQVEYYKLVPDAHYGFVVDVDGSVYLVPNTLHSILVKFNAVTGHFICSNNQLTSLQGAPTSVGINFSCQNNKITSLEYCPVSIGEDFICSNNKLNNLDHLPQSVKKKFYCHDNPLLGIYQSITDLEKLKEIILSGKERALLSDSLQKQAKAILHKV